MTVWGDRASCGRLRSIFLPSLLALPRELPQSLVMRVHVSPSPIPPSFPGLPRPLQLLFTFCVGASRPRRTPAIAPGSSIVGSPCFFGYKVIPTTLQSDRDFLLGLIFFVSRTSRRCHHVARHGSIQYPAPPRSMRITIPILDNMRREARS
jgi:hypothetical protein